MNTVNKCIRRAIEGYERAPLRNTPEETFTARLKILTHYGKMEELWTVGENIASSIEDTPEKVNYEDHKYEPPKEIVIDIPSDEEGKTETITIKDIPFLQFLDVEEAEYYKKRRAFYIREFEFNESGDQVLLEALIADEVILRRILNGRLSGKPISDEMVDDIQKRIRETLKSLGISRQQRVADNTNQKGNVSQLSETLDKKLENIREMKDSIKRNIYVVQLMDLFTDLSMEDIYNVVEELVFMRKRSLRTDMENVEPIPTINELPLASEIDKTLRDWNKKELN